MRGPIYTSIHKSLALYVDLYIPVYIYKSLALCVDLYIPVYTSPWPYAWTYIYQYM